MRCLSCGSIVSPLLSECPNCLNALPMYKFAGKSKISLDIETPIQEITHVKNIEIKNNNCDKVYTLAYTNKTDKYVEQTTYLIDDDKKIIIKFYNDDYNNGTNANNIKAILDFLAIKYFEFIYSIELPKKYRYNYKIYDSNGNITDLY